MVDLSNLSLHTPYEGMDNMVIGDGNGLTITHFGSFSLSHNNSQFYFDKVLCIPAMKKNLIFVSQFCKTNHVSIIFLSNSFQVKDFHTGTLLL